MLAFHGGIDGHRGTLVSDGISFALDEHGVDPHRLVILSATDDDWIERLAEMYRALRTTRRLPDPVPGALPPLAGVDVLDTTRLNRMLVDTQIAKRRGGNFDVLRSDLAEVLLGHVGERLGGFRYGYISVRDRESARQPGRGIDQVGVRIDENDAIHLMLGEAKVSSDPTAPPRVVDYNDDSLSKSHAKQLKMRANTLERIMQAYRYCTDPETQTLFGLAGMQFEDIDPRLIVHLTSLLVRPSSLAVPADFGSYADTPDQFTPGVIEFYLVTTATDDIEALVDKFAELIGVDSEEEDAA